MKNRTLLLACACLFAMTPLMANATTQITNDVTTTSDTKDYGGVTDQQIIDYMAGFGINIVAIGPQAGTTNAICLSDKGVRYIVYTSNGTITGWDEMGL